MSHQRRISPREEARRERVYLATSSDKEAARRLKIDRGTFLYWRQTRGLPCKHQQGGSNALSPSAQRLRIQVYHESKNDVEAAAKLGIGRGAYGEWRRNEGLPAKDLRGRWLPKEIQEARMRAYEQGLNDKEAAEVVGMDYRSFRSWRIVHGLKAKSPPGRKQFITPYQEKLLAYLAEHPWSKEFEVYKAFDANLGDALRRLEGKDRVRRGYDSRRIAHWALVDAPFPDGIRELKKGAPSLYHLPNLPQRILEALEKTPWLTVRQIVERVRPAGTPKSVDAAVRQLEGKGTVHRRIIETDVRRFYVYALPSAKRLSAKRKADLEDEIIGQYGWGEANVKILAFLGQRKRAYRDVGPWYSAREISEGAGVRMGFVYNCLKRLLIRKKIQRVRILEDRSRWEKGNRFVYALPGLPFPDNAAPDDDLSKVTTQAKVALIVREHDGIDALGVMREYVRSRRQVSLPYVQNVLKELCGIGVIKPIYGPYAKSIRGYRANGSVDAAVLKAAKQHWDVIKSHRSRLVSLGYRVDIQLHPPNEKMEIQEEPTYDPA